MKEIKQKAYLNQKQNQITKNKHLIKAKKQPN
jgi:hypothetical protein